MDTNNQEEIGVLLQKEGSARKYFGISFLFGVFFLATLKDFISAGFESAFVIIRLALIIGFILLTVYFYLKADSMLNSEAKDKISSYRESLKQNEVEGEGKEKLIEKYLVKSDLQSFKKIIYILWGAIFVLFMALAMLFPASTPTEEPTATDKTVKTDTVSGKTTTPVTNTTVR